MKITPPKYPNSPVRVILTTTPIIIWPVLLTPLLIMAVATVGMFAAACGTLWLLGFFSLKGFLIWLIATNALLYLASAIIGAKEFYTDLGTELKEWQNTSLLVIGLFVLAEAIISEFCALPIVALKDRLWKKWYYGPT